MLMYTITKKWRNLPMNKDEIVNHMISYIEDAERDLQAANMAGESRTSRTDIVNSILNELEREVKNED